jgi:hypothetical protein
LSGAFTDAPDFFSAVHRQSFVNVFGRTGLTTTRASVLVLQFPKHRSVETAFVIVIPGG